MPKTDDAPKMKDLMTGSEAADALGVSRQHINRMFKKGEFQTLKALGERPIYVVDTAEVKKMVKARQKAAAQRAETAAVGADS